MNEQPRKSPSRRRFMKQLAAGAVVLSTVRPGSLLLAGRKVPAVRGRKVLELAELLRKTPREKVFEKTVDQIQAGVNHREVLGGTLLAGILDVSPRPAGTKFHTVLMFPAALELAEAATPDQLWTSVFFNIHTLKNSQERDIREGDWVLPAAPASLTDDAAVCRTRLDQSLRAWDEAQADRAAVSAAKLLPLDELFELLWPMGARDFRNIGHKMIHTAQLYRALEMMDGVHREPAIRSLVYGLLWGEPGPSTEAFETSLERIGEFPKGWDRGRAETDFSAELMTKLRTVDSGQAVEMAVAAIKRGVAPESIWDGLRLIASEMLFRMAPSEVRNAQLLAVHPLTVVNAFHFAYRRSRRETTRRLMLLQAVAWTPLARDLLIRAKELSMEGPGLDALEVPQETISVDEAVKQSGSDYAKSASMVLRMARHEEAAQGFIERCRSLVLRKSPEHHHHKYAVAAFEEFAWTHPRWSPYVLAPCLSYLPTPSDEESGVYRRTRAALGQLAG